MKNHLKCACLVALNNNSLLLVRVRDNQKWYLPGGKIEPNETAEQALIRELSEELNIQIIPDKDSKRYDEDYSKYFIIVLSFII
jgi:8-oxo-dGTP pyrophosphatase MutT (NUDIX family)